MTINIAITRTGDFVKNIPYKNMIIMDRLYGKKLFGITMITEELKHLVVESDAALHA